MKRFLFTLAAFSLACGQLFSQTDRLVLFEHFTQASCPPCAAQNPAFNALLDANAGDVISIKYQVSWPGYDPMYEQNSSQIDERVDDYGFTGVPTVFMDGNVTTDEQPDAFDQAAIDTRAAVTSDISMNISHAFVNDAVDSITVTTVITNTTSSDYAAGKMFRLALVEREIEFPVAPGSNGETEFSSVMREMFPSVDGTTMPLIAAGASETYTWTVAVPDYIYNLNEIAFVGFVQDGATGLVDQAGYSAPIALPSALTLLDVAGEAASTGPSGYCNYDLTPAIEVTNDGTQTIETVTVGYSLNGGTQVTQTETVSLAGGASTTVSFPQVTINGGETEVEYEVITTTAVGGGSGIDPNSLNQLIANDYFYTLSPAAVGTTIAEDFAGLGSFTPAPDNAILDNPDDIAFFVIEGSAANLTDLGGFGQSNECYMFDFYSIQTGSATLLFDKVDLSGYTSPELTFSRAYAQYVAENDQLEVIVSTDCGSTWDILYDKAGNDLATASPDQSRFFPAAGEWVSDTVDLSSYNTATELIIGFRGTTAYGNSAYIDDLNIAEKTSVSVAKLEETSSLTVMPNPVRNQMQIQFEMTEATDLNVEVYNALGQMVIPVANQTFDGLTTLSVNTASLASGVYFVRMTSKEGSLTKRFTVEK